MRSRWNLPSLEIPEGAFCHTHRERVRLADTDAASIVYYGTYQRFFEAGRVELMRAAGLSGSSIMDRGLLLPVIETWVRFHVPARYDDLLEVLTWVHEVGGASVLMGSRVLRDGTLLVEGGTRVVCHGRDGRLRRSSVLFAGLDPGERRGG